MPAWIEPGGGPEQWRKLHKYADGRPVRWICNYVDLLSDDDYLDLTGEQRSILHGLWLAFASARAHLRADPRSLSRRLALRVTTAQLESLEQAGWLRLSVTKPSRKRYGFDTSRATREDRRGEEGIGGSSEDLNPLPPVVDVGTNDAHDKDIPFDVPDIFKTIPD